MATLRLDEDMLIEAIEGFEGADWYLDVQTGEFLFCSEYGDSDVDPEDLEEDTERYRFIEAMDSDAAFCIMEDFVDTLPESEAKRVLAKALTRPKPFRNFKDDLCDFPDIREQWFEYHHKTVRTMAEEWLKEQQIDAELISGKEYYESRQ